MEVVLVGNLLEATKGLEEGEILFCPMHYWAKSLNHKIGGVVEENGQVRPPTSGEFDRAMENLLLSTRSFTYRESFFYASRSDWMRKRWEELSEGIKKNEEYLKKEIVEDLNYIAPLFKYDLFLDISKVTGNSETVKIVTEKIKAMLEKEVREELIRVEMEKKEKYIEALSKTLEFKLIPEKLELLFVMSPRVREKGTEDYIKEGKAYKEFTKSGKEILIIRSNQELIYSMYGFEERDQLPNGLGVKYCFSKPEIDKDRIHLVLLESKIFYDGRERTYLFGFPFFRVRFSSVDVEFRSRNVAIGKRKELKGVGGVAQAKLNIKNFLITLDYIKEPEVIDGGKEKRVIETNKIIEISVKAENRTDNVYSMSPDKYRICDIEILEDGGFSVRMDHNNIYKVQIIASDKASEEANEIAKKEPREGVSWLIEKWTHGKKTIKLGKIIGEKSEGIVYKKKIFALKEEKYSDEEKNEIDRHIKSKLEELVKRVLKVETILDKDNYPYQRRSLEVILVRPEEKEELIEEIQTGFIQSKIKRNLKYLEKIEELCFESREGERQKIKYLGLGEQKEDLRKIAQEVALYGTGINLEKLKGVNKSVMEVLKLMTYSYPLLTQYTLKMILDELRERVSSALSTDVVPLEEIEMSIYTINPSIALSDSDPKALALFSVEGDKVKVYINDGEEKRIHGKITEYVKIGIGGIEVKV
jgi:hypothetical protein